MYLHAGGYVFVSVYGYVYVPSLVDVVGGAGWWGVEEGWRRWEGREYETRDHTHIYTYTLWLFNIAIRKSPFIDDF